MNAETGVTCVLSTHDPRLLEHVPRHVQLADGRIVSDHRREAAMDYLALAWRNLRRNSRRSLTTLLSIAIGFAAVGLFSGYTRRVYEGLGDQAVHGELLGHLTLVKRGMRTEGRLHPERYLLRPDEIARLSEIVARRFPGARIAPRLGLSGLASNGQVQHHLPGGRGGPADLRALRGDRWAGTAALAEASPQGVVAAGGLAGLLGLRPGDDASLLVSTLHGQANAADAEVLGTYHTGNAGLGCLGGLAAMLAGRLSFPCRVVFVTAYDQYAVEAFEREAVDYLLKPVSDERLERTLARLRQAVAAPPPPLPEGLLDQLRALLDRPGGPEPLRWIKAQAGETVRLVSVDEISHFQAGDKLRHRLHPRCGAADPDPHQGPGGAAGSAPVLAGAPRHPGERQAHRRRPPGRHGASHPAAEDPPGAAGREPRVRPPVPADVRVALPPGWPGPVRQRPYTEAVEELHARAHRHRGPYSSRMAPGPEHAWSAGQPPAGPDQRGPGRTAVLRPQPALRGHRPQGLPLRGPGVHLRGLPPDLGPAGQHRRAGEPELRWLFSMPAIKVTSAILMAGCWGLIFFGEKGAHRGRAPAFRPQRQSA